MAQSNWERVGKMMDLLQEGLRPFVERELRAKYGKEWESKALDCLRTEEGLADFVDVASLLTVMKGLWTPVFKPTLGKALFPVVMELKDVRNRWAHQQAFTTEDAYRALDSGHRLLTAVSAADQAAEVDGHRQALLRDRFQEQARRDQKKAAAAPIQGTPIDRYAPWREIAVPHPDVRSGRFRQVEFVADLSQVDRKKAETEYQEPVEFFRRTYLTEGLRKLLVGALQRLAGQTADPVIQLQTNFGGGKTHSLLALYHMVSGAMASDLPGMDEVVREAGVKELVQAKKAVLVGTAFDPAKPREKQDGTKTNTLWGEMAYQLLGKKGYALVAESDQHGVSPGSETLQELFNLASPCIVLIDEWVALVRQLVDKRDLPVGSFEANITFAQALTEAVRVTPQTVVVLSIPVSEYEVGGEGGTETLKKLQMVVGRAEASWRPASTEEGFEIVRRRLFEPIADHRTRDSVARAFAEMYQKDQKEFPAACIKSDYEKRIQASYPIHPELFDRLYDDWSTLERFQRTRGVLRLMAAVIHALWERDDRNLLILPATIPIDEQSVRDELVRYLEDNWVPAIERDVDGPNSTPHAIDGENPNLGKYSACRRVARTVFLGSAPHKDSANRGVSALHVKLGSAQPGESPAVFGDALRRLSENARHLNYENGRYFIAPQTSLNSEAADRAFSRFTADDVEEEVLRRLRDDARSRGVFARVHAAPASSADVPDEPEARLVVLGPGATHEQGNDASPALAAAREILDARGNSPRRYRNMLVFLAPDRARLDDLEKAVRFYLAWRSIADESKELDLTQSQLTQAGSRAKEYDETAAHRLPETYFWVLVPGQEKEGGVRWDAARLRGGEGSLAQRAGKKLENDEQLVSHLAGTLLRMELDRVPLWRGEGNHVNTWQLQEDFGQYLYLPRIRSGEVLVESIRNGVERTSWDIETFAYADDYDDTKKRYLGLRGGEMGGVTIDKKSVVVKPEAARRQWEAEKTPSDSGGSGGGAGSGSGAGDGGRGGGGGGTILPPVKEKKYRRFHGSVTLDPLKLSTEAGKIHEAVVQHLQALDDADLEITLEIKARIPDGAPDHAVRTVTENCNTLKFREHGFEGE